MNNTSEAILGLDAAGRIRSWNPAAERIYGYTPLEIINKDFSILFPSDTEGDERLIAKGKLDTGGRVNGWDVRQLHKNGSIVHTCIDMWELSGPGGTFEGTCVAARGIARYRMLQSQLRQTAKLETVGRLASGIAHDFNNLLTVISGYTNMIMSDLPSDSDMVQWAIEVDKAADRASLLTNQLLAFSRREVTQLQVLNVNDVVRDLDRMLRRIIGDDVKISLLLEPGIANIKADPGQLSQVLTNLAANARDAMPRGGTMTIATTSAYFDNPVAQHEYELPPGPYVELTVGDTGCGMDQETREHLFEPFFTTKTTGNGTGLGLSIVFGIVTQLRGAISVTSEPGSGTVFTLRLPATTELVEKRAHAVVAPACSPGVTVLIVEDDGDLRHLIRHMLLGQGYTVYETADACEAIRICQTIRIDVLLTDMVMPDMTGVELAEKAVDASSSLKVLYMSGYTSETAPVNGLELGRNFLQKPFTAARLNEHIIGILNPVTRVASASALSFLN